MLYYWYTYPAMMLASQLVICVPCLDVTSETLARGSPLTMLSQVMVDQLWPHGTTSYPLVGKNIYWPNEKQIGNQTQPQDIIGGSKRCNQVQLTGYRAQTEPPIQITSATVDVRLPLPQLFTTSCLTIMVHAGHAVKNLWDFFFYKATTTAAATGGGRRSASRLVFTKVHIPHCSSWSDIAKHSWHLSFRNWGGHCAGGITDLASELAVVFCLAVNAPTV